MNQNCAYVRQHYQVPNEVGRRVIAYGTQIDMFADHDEAIACFCGD